MKTTLYKAFLLLWTILLGLATGFLAGILFPLGLEAVQRARQAFDMLPRSLDVLMGRKQ